MIKKIIGIATILVLAVGVFSLSYAKENNNIIVNKPLSTETSIIDNNGECARDKNMLDIMKQYGYGDFAKELENGNYKSMNDFMNNITDEDYQEMIDLMRENNPAMANAMEGIGRERMINMHNAIGSAGSCHNTYNSNLNVY